MRCGLSVPGFGELADPGVVAELAEEAEVADWDGFFVWDHVYYRPPVEALGDPWISLAAVAMATTKILLGPMVTPLARRRPHVLARQLTALVQLSRGRVIFGAGLGLDQSGEEFLRFGEGTDVRRRAEMYDEALDLLRALLSGEEVHHDGPHYKALDVRFLPVAGDLPIWIAARWPNQSPLRRAARHKGVFVTDLRPADLDAVRSTVSALRAGSLEGFDFVVHSREDDPQQWKRAGATWWLATFSPFSVTAAEIRAKIRQGPAR